MRAEFVCVGVRVFMGKNGIISVIFMGEFWRSMKQLHTSKNTAMGYSAAYPTGAERCLFQGLGDRS